MFSVDNDAVAATAKELENFVVYSRIRLRQWINEFNQKCVRTISYHASCADALLRFGMFGMFRWWCGVANSDIISWGNCECPMLSLVFVIGLVGTIEMTGFYFPHIIAANLRHHFLLLLSVAVFSIRIRRWATIGQRSTVDSINFVYSFCYCCLAVVSRFDSNESGCMIICHKVFLSEFSKLFCLFLRKQQNQRNVHKNLCILCDHRRRLNMRT